MLLSSEPERDSMVRVRLLTFVTELRKLAVGAGSNAFVLMDDFLSEWVCGMVDEVGVSVLHPLGALWPTCFSRLFFQLKELSQDRPHYYLNSYTHRLRLRAVQTLILTCKWLDQVIETTFSILV